MQEEEKVGWRQELLSSRDEGRGGGGGAGANNNNPEFPCSRPNSFLSLESSDMGSEDGIRADLVGGDSFSSGSNFLANQLMEFVVGGDVSAAAAASDSLAGLQSSTPVKDTTPTNEELAAGSGPESGGNNSAGNSLLLLESDADSVTGSAPAGNVASDC